MVLTTNLVSMCHTGRDVDWTIILTTSPGKRLTNDNIVPVLTILLIRIPMSHSLCSFSSSNRLKFVGIRGTLEDGTVAVLLSWYPLSCLGPNEKESGKWQTREKDVGAMV